MPVYIVHGFRWPRGGLSGIRVFVVLHNVEDAAAEYIQQPVTAKALLETFKRIEPDAMSRLPRLHFIEQYDPDDLSDNAVSQPYAYVADKVLTIPDKTMPENGLGRNIEELVKQGSGLSEESQQALAELKDKYAPDEQIGWWVVYNGDPERGYDDEEYAEQDEEEGEEEEAVSTRPNTAGTTISRPHTAGSIFRREARQEKIPVSFSSLDANEKRQMSDLFNSQYLQFQRKSCDTGFSAERLPDPDHRRDNCTLWVFLYHPYLEPLHHIRPYHI